MRENTGKNYNCRSRQGLYLEINFTNRVDCHIYIFVQDPQTHGSHGPTCKCTDGHTDGRTDTQEHGRTRRWADGHAEARTQTQTHGRRRRSMDADAEARTQMRRCRSTDADASTRWRTDAKYSCVQCVGGKIVQTHPASGRTHKDLRGVLYIASATYRECS